MRKPKPEAEETESLGDVCRAILYLIDEGFVAVFEDEHGCERYRLKTSEEIAEELECI